MQNDSTFCKAAARIIFTMRNSKVTGEVVVVLPTFDDYSQELLSGLTAFLEVHRDFTPLFLSSRDSQLEDLPDFRNRISGVITWANPDDRWIYPFLEDEIPVINCGADWLREKRIHSVFNNHAKVELVAIDHFVELGMDNVYMALHDLSQHHGMERRVKSFEQYARSLNLNPSVLFIEGELPDYGVLRLLNSEGKSKLRDRLQQLPKPCGIFCENDH
jgi:DNA-binding LacI/PurR family transcriptional regulator